MSAFATSAKGGAPQRLSDPTQASANYVVDDGSDIRPYEEKRLIWLNRGLLCGFFLLLLTTAIGVTFAVTKASNASESATPKTNPGKVTGEMPSFLATLKQNTLKQGGSHGGSGCRNSDGDATDNEDHSCSDYDASMCAGVLFGAADDDDFKGGDMCCVCGGGETVEWCIDTDYASNGDKNGDKCSSYTFRSCGDYDDDDFEAKEMCCVCGGGSTEALKYGCINTDNDATDSDGESCSDYTNTYCGISDDSDFKSNDMCCVCNGGQTTLSCVDTDSGTSGDKDGDYCEDYIDYTWCGEYDDEDFTANELCCTCGGGSTSQAIRHEAPPFPAAH